jgi:hypothetical protein
VTEPQSVPAPAPSADGQPAQPTGPAVIRIIHGAEESPHDRLMKKHVPAWVVSGAFHVIILVVAILIGFAKQTDARPSDDLIQAAVDDKPEEKQFDLTNPDMGLDSDLKAAVEVDRQDDLNVEGKVVKDEPVGVATTDTNPPMDIPQLAGTGDKVDVGAIGTDGNVMKGDFGMNGVMVGKAFQGRSAGSRDPLLKAGGGNAASEAAVALGLVWLAKMQKANGAWVYDGSSAADTPAATGMGLLPFLAAGQTHKKPLGKASIDYTQTVAKGLDFLLKSQQPSGSFAGASNMYSHAIATLALCEAYGMTGDKGKLQYPCQRAINYIITGQGNNGSWGYVAKGEGDTSIVGWQVQALKSAEMCKDLTVDKGVQRKASRFLDSVSDSSKKATYGYRTGPGAPGTALTAVGLLCRYYIDGWGSVHPGMSEGVKGLVTRRPPSPNQFDMYYYYYATQVVHFHEGDVWHKDWNPKMRDMLINMQVKANNDKVRGSWDADKAIIGSSCGRLGTTCLALLTLEVYYRHLPTYKRDTGGMKELERGK